MTNPTILVLVGVTTAAMFAKEPTGSATTVITGVIHGNGTSVLAGATVKVAGGSDSAITDASGRYTLRDVPRGAVSISVRRAGFSEFTLRELTIASDTLHYTAELPPNPPTRFTQKDPTMPVPIVVMRYSVDSVSVRVGPDFASWGVAESLIESVNIIKRPRAVSWFGESAAGGVILVLTKAAQGYPFAAVPR